MAVRSSIALEDPAAEDEDFLAFLVGRLDDMVMYMLGYVVTGSRSVGWLKPTV